MTSIKDLRQMNETMIIYLEKMSMDSRRNKIISNILEDDACFFKMTKKEAFEVLEGVGIDKEKIYPTYLELTSNDEMNRLISEGKLSKEEVKIEINNYNVDEMFKKR